MWWYTTKDTSKAFAKDNAKINNLTAIITVVIVFGLAGFSMVAYKIGFSAGATQFLNLTTALVTGLFAGGGIAEYKVLHS
jgi:hypothetical protein